MEKERKKQVKVDGKEKYRKEGKEESTIYQ